MPGFEDVGELAKTIGTLNAVLIFVVFVLAMVVFYLLRILQSREKAQGIINNKILEFLMNQTVRARGSGEEENRQVNVGRQRSKGDLTSR